MQEPRQLPNPDIDHVECSYFVCSPFVITLGLSHSERTSLVSPTANWNQVIPNVDRSPFRTPVLTDRTDTSNWTGTNKFEYRDDMSWWQDGTSNIIAMTEKHIPTGNHLWETGFDSTWLFAESERFVGTIRGFRSGIQFPDSLTNTSPNKANLEPFSRVGSWHPGVCQAVLGDGSVRGLTVSTNIDTLLYISNVNDGVTPALP